MQACIIQNKDDINMISKHRKYITLYIFTWIIFTTTSILSFVKDSLSITITKKIFTQYFQGNSEAFASELIENFK